MGSKTFVIGMDFGTDSVRASIVNALDGAEVATSVVDFPRWKQGLYCDPANNQFRQHPLDHIEGLEQAIRGALSKAPAGTAEKVAAITVDTTGSTPGPVDREGTPLAMNNGFGDNPNAMFVLWKDHTAVKEAEEINRLAKKPEFEDYTKYEGGVYSSEWFWAKIMHVYRQDAQIKEAAFSWMEHCDWLPALLTGSRDVFQVKRSRCAAGHKAMWHPDWNGLPPEEFLTTLDPSLKGLRERLYQTTCTSDVAAGTLSPEWAEKLGLDEDVTVGVGAFDAHLGAVGANIKPYYLSKVMGTSTCDILVAPREEVGEKLVRGIAGQVDGSVFPGMVGLEAGQSAFGDVYAWFSKVLMWPLENLLSQTTLIDKETAEKLREEMRGQIIPKLSEEAARIPPEETAELALDWMNGRRTPDANQLLKGAITGISLGTDAPRIFRALVEATAFGAKAIVERMLSEGVRIDGLIGLGGVAKKSPFVMQTIADVLERPIEIARAKEVGALGSAMAASVVAGIHPSFKKAQEAMGSGFETTYTPNESQAAVYRQRYENYKALGAFVEDTLTGQSSE